MTTTDFNACDVYIDIITLLILKQCVSLSDKSETKNHGLFCTWTVTSEGNRIRLAYVVINKRVIMQGRSYGGGGVRATHTFLAPPPPPPTKIHA